ncbi:hypothetical protein JHK87_000788 [Glycine soja]|nr:hypothetical protein JHK87_000788 [Glycine soja]
MDAIVSTATENALQIGGGAIKRHVGYFFNYNEKFEEVKHYIEMLSNARKRVQNEVTDVEMNAEEIEDDVQQWLKQVDEKIKKYKSFIHDECHAKTRCSFGFFPNNLQWRYRLGSNATKMIEEIKIEELWNKRFDKVSYRVRPSIDSAFANTGYESFVSRTKTMEMIMEALKDSKVNMIGVYGVGGVGKTTVVKEVAKKAQEKKLFNMVIIANITRNPDIKKIQGQIAEMLGMRLEEETEIVRANRIRKRIKKEKENTLIILDDLWDGLDLNRLGIPSKKLSGDHKGCKILLTSRSKEVICNQMDVSETSTFLVGVIDEKEAETLLKKVAGIHVTNSMFDANAIEIAKMCAGLPIALVSIGRALKNKSYFVWEDVCRQIKRQSFIEAQESIEFSIKLSYDHLKNEELKRIFLQCARMGSDALIMDLVKFCIGLGLLQGVHTIRDARYRVNVLIEELKESSLLVESYSTDRYNIHDIVRDVALSISSKQKHWPHEDEYERYTAIFLHYCDINDELHESIYCPRLEVLHIDSKNEFLEIPDDFFKDMIRLRVLVLTGVNLSFLPSSIKCLKKLRMLCLERCTLGKNLSFIGELKKLRILSLSESNIESLPLEFGQLDKLQLFDLSNCSKLRVIPSNIISRMNILEEFYMRDSLVLWDSEQKIQSGNAYIHIPSVDHFPQNVFFDNLDSYKIVIGEFNMFRVGEFRMPDKYEVVKFLAFNLKEGIDIHSEKWIKMLFKGVENLFLGELNDVHDVLNELNVEGFSNLKDLCILNNSEIQYIIHSKGQLLPLRAFPKLESMCLYTLDNLEKISDNRLTEASFCKLKIIKIKKCGQLKNLFPFSMVSHLTMLETIEVCECDSLKEIVSVERETHTICDDKIEFPQLRILTLQSLPVSIPKLEWLELSSINIQKIWSDQSLHCFQNLLTFNVIDCGNLKYLLSFSMARSLVNLQSLFVSSCKMMEDIFLPEDARNIDVFPKLKKMEMVFMEKLNTIWQPHIGLHSFHNLDSLIIRQCDKLVTIFPSYMEQRFQSLQRLIIIDCKLVENIFDFENIPETCDRNETNLHYVFLQALPKLVHVWREDTSEILKYNNLQSISINGSPNLKYLFPLFVANELEKLEYLSVSNCGVMKEIVAWDKGSNENVITFKFPHLNCVSLQQLFELVSFYRGPHTLEWPSLKKLGIHNCYKLALLPTEIKNSQAQPIVLATEKVIYNLELMAMSLKEVEWLQKYIVSAHIMHNLQTLTLGQLKNTEILFWFLHRLPNLQTLTLEFCHFKRIWVPASLISCEKIGVVMQLKELELYNLIYLEEIGFEHDPLLQRLERLVICECIKLTNLMSSSVSFYYLTHLQVDHCRLMRNLMTSSTAKSMVQLTTMKVSFYEMIVEIIAENEEENVQEIEFRQLKSLELVSLQNLTSSCNFEKCDLKFLLLENLVVRECSQMTKFSNVQSAPNLQKVHVVVGEKDKWYWEGDLNVTLQKIVTDQKLEFDVAGKRDIVIPSHVLPYLKSLEELNVHSSDAVRVIFDIDDSDANTKKGIVFHLKNLTSKGLSNLECIWNKNPEGIVRFPNLEKVVVDGCGRLVTLFPSSLARNLGNLKALVIWICSSLVAIVGKGNAAMEHGTTEMFEFPCLSLLNLWNMPLLSCFYHGKHHLECPILETLYVVICPKLKLFTSEAVVPKLKALSLNEQNIILLSDAQFPRDLLGKLKILLLWFEDFDNEKDTLPFDFILKVPSLEHLRVQRCFGLTEIFPSQVRHGILAGLKQLFLYDLKELELIGLEQPWVKPYSEKLEVLQLRLCSRLEKLVCFAVSFINLKELVVSDCKMMEYLFTFSTAKSLVQLEILQID